MTLYKEQWLKLLNMSDDIRAFIAENEARLKAKDRQLTGDAIAPQGKGTMADTGSLIERD